MILILFFGSNASGQPAPGNFPFPHSYLSWGFGVYMSLKAGHISDKI